MTTAVARAGRRALEWWERFWFEPVPPDSYALLRIAFGLLGILHLIGATPIPMFWTPAGIMPIAGAGLGVRAALSGGAVGVLFGWAFYFGLLIAFGAMTLGAFTSWVVPLCFLGSVAEGAWNRLPLSSAYQVLVAVLFYLMWADCAGAPSLDAWRAGRAGSTVRRQPSIWPLRLIRFQVALLYLNSGLWKLTGVPWQNGSAVHYVLNMNIFHRFPGGVPVALDWTLVSATYLTVFWEVGFAFMLFNRWTRIVALAAGVLLHAGLWASLELGPFSAMMIASYLAFLDPRWVARIVRHRITPSSASASAYANSAPNIPFSHDSAHADNLHAFDVARQRYRVSSARTH